MRPTNFSLCDDIFSKGIKSLNNRNKTPIKSMPDKWPIPQKSPTFQAFFLLSIAKGVTAAKWSGPEITCSVAAIMPANSGKLITITRLNKREVKFKNNSLKKSQLFDKLFIRISEYN